MLDFFEVIWVFDRSTRPPKPKMFVCLSFEDGWFLRINTSDKFRPCVAISQSDHPWLDHDSHIECALLELDEYEIEESLRYPGVEGAILMKHLSEVQAKLLTAPYLRPDDKAKLRMLLGEREA